MAKDSNQNRDNRANQLNPNNDAYHRSRDGQRADADQRALEEKAARDNRANQLNPNNKNHPENK